MNQSSKIIRLLSTFVILFAVVAFLMTKVNSLVLNISPTDTSKNEHSFKLSLQLTSIKENNITPVFNGQNWLYLIKTVNIYDYNGKQVLTVNTNKTINVQHLSSIIKTKLPRMIKVSISNSEVISNSLYIVSIISYSASVTMLLMLFFYGVLCLSKLLKRAVIKTVKEFKIEENDNQNKYMYIGFILLFVGLIVLSFSYLAFTNFKSVFFNADVLFLPAIMQDLFHGGSIFNWSFSVSTFFFPDYLLILIPYLITKNNTIMFLLYFNLQLLLFFYLVQMLFRVYFSKVKSIYFSGWVSFLCAITATIPFEQTNVYKIQLLPLFHFGAFLILLMLLNLLLRVFRSDQHKPLYYLAVFIISTVGTLSDSFVILWFVLPGILSLMIIHVFGVKKIKIPCFLMTGSFIGGLSGVYLLKFFHINSRGGVHFIQFKFADIMKQVFFAVSFIKDLGVVFLLLVLFFIATIMALTVIVKIPKSSNLLKFILTFYVVSTIIIISVQFFAQNLGFQARYDLNILFIPVVLMVPVLYYFLSANQLSALFICLLIIPFIKIMQAKVLLSEYYPESVVCVDKLLKPYDIHNGIANYWDARFFTFLSRSNLKINAVNGTTLTAAEALEPLKIPTNYDFALINSNPGDKLPDYYLNESMIYKINGKPLRRLTNCKDTIILIYKKNGLRINNRD